MGFARLYRGDGVLFTRREEAPWRELQGAPHCEEEGQRLDWQWTPSARVPVYQRPLPLQNQTLFQTGGIGWKRSPRLSNLMR